MGPSFQMLGTMFSFMTLPSLVSRSTETEKRVSPLPTKRAPLNSCSLKPGIANGRLRGAGCGGWGVVDVGAPAPALPVSVALVAVAAAVAVTRAARAPAVARRTARACGGRSDRDIVVRPSVDVSVNIRVFGRG